MDVGARQEIHQRILELAAGGTAVIVASANYEEFPQLCDRVIVFRKGSVVTEISGDLNEEAIAKQCFAV